MNDYLLSAAIVCGALAAGVLGAPIYVCVRAPHHRSELQASARSRLVPCALMIAFGAAACAHISFASHLLNMAAEFGALCCGFFLCLFMFELKPKWLAVPVGGLLGLMVAGLILALLLAVLFDGDATSGADIGDGMVCQASPSDVDGGDQIDVYRRYLMIDRRLMRGSLTDPPSAAEPQTPWQHATALRCDAAFKALRDRARAR